MRTPRDTAKAWIEAYNSAAPSRLASLYRECGGLMIAHQGGARGRDNIAAHYQSWFEDIPGALIVENLIEQDGWLALEWTCSMGLKGCDTIHIIDGEIALHRRYFDSRTCNDVKAMISKEATKSSA